MPPAPYQTYRKVNDLPGSKLGEQLSHIFFSSGNNKSPKTDLSSSSPHEGASRSTSTSVAPSRQVSPSRGLLEGKQPQKGGVGAGVKGMGKYYAF